MDTPDKQNSQLAATITLLEEKFSFQQRQLEELNSVIVQHQTELDRLKRELGQVVDLAENLVGRLGEDLPHEKPPHY